MTTTYDCWSRINGVDILEIKTPYRPRTEIKRPLPEVKHAPVMSEVDIERYAQGPRLNTGSRMMSAVGMTHFNDADIERYRQDPRQNTKMWVLPRKSYTGASLAGRSLNKPGLRVLSPPAPSPEFERGKQLEDELLEKIRTREIVIPDMPTGNP
jgi:hypothetical protein